MIPIRFGLPLAAVAVAAAVYALPTRGQEAKGPEVGQMAPDFSLPDQTGAIRHLADYRGKTVILAFYPKDFTGGWTCEVQALRDAMAKLQARNAVVFGISADTVESHKGFVEKEHLNFPLLADPGKKVIAAYGALMPNGQMANRYTFVIGPDGRIVSIDRNVNGQFDRGDGKLTSRHGDNLALLLSNWKAKIGQQVPTFGVADVEGRSVDLLPAGKKAAVVVFVSTTCPVSNAYEGRLAALAADPAYKDVAFLALDANANETAAAVASHYAGKLPFPVAKDAKSALADHFGANNTPTVWVVNAKGVAVYSGAVDDSQDAAAVKQPYLKNALDAALAGQPVATPQTRAVGWAIRRR